MAIDIDPLAIRIAQMLRQHWWEIQPMPKVQASRYIAVLCVEHIRKEVYEEHREEIVFYRTYIQQLGGKL